MNRLVNLAKAALVDKPAAALRANACLLCAAPQAGELCLCPACTDALPALAGQCRHCAEPLPAGQTGPCARCQRRLPAFDAVQAGWHYAGPLPWLVQGLKFHGQLAVGRSLGLLLARRQQTTVDVLLPVPLHPARLRERGYNQARELALPLARELDLPIDDCGLRRQRATLPQPGQAIAARARNVRGAFACEADLGDARIAIIDDVMTTGATAGELAALLKRQGAARVEIWPVARAGRAQLNH